MTEEQIQVEKQILKYTRDRVSKHYKNACNVNSKYRSTFTRNDAYTDSAWDSYSHTTESVEVRHFMFDCWRMIMWDANGTRYWSAFTYDREADAIAAATVVGDVLMDVPMDQLFA